jgi:hypothetical protein
MKLYMFRTVPLSIIRSFHCTHSDGICRTGLLTACEQDQDAVFVVGPAGRPARPRTQHDCHHDTKVKPEAATAVIGLLLMGRKTPETC